MTIKKIRTDESTEQQNNEQKVDDQPDRKPSVQRQRDHQPDAYPTGYEPFGETRVGIGTATGNIKRLIRHNEGRHHSDGNHSAREAARDKKRITQSLCSSLEVTSYQQQQAISAMGSMNLDRFGQQKRIEKVALCTIRVIVDWNREQYFLNGKDPADLDLATVDTDQFPTKLEEDSQYDSLCEQHDLSKTDRNSITRLVKRELRQIGYFERDDRPLR